MRTAAIGFGFLGGLGLSAAAYFHGALYGVVLGLATTLGTGVVLAVSRRAPASPDGDLAVVETDPARGAPKHRLAALLDVNAPLGPLPRIESLFATIADACERLFEADSVAYRVVDGEELILVGTWGRAADTHLSRRVKLGEGISGRVALTGEPLLIDDPEHDPRVIPQYRTVAREQGCRGMLGVPVRTGGRVAGVIIIRTRRPSGFSPTDVSIASAFAAQVGVSTENVLLFGALARANERLRFLFEAARQATVSLSLSDGLPHLVRWATELTTADASSIRLLDPTESTLELVAGYGVSERFGRGAPVPVQAVKAVLGGQTVTVADFGREPDAPFHDEALAEGLRSMVCVPLRSRDRVIGTFSVYNGSPQSFTEEEITSFAEFANLAAISIENARLHRRTEERTEKLTTLSTLTRLINSAGECDSVFDAVAMAAATLLHAGVVHVWADESDGLGLKLRGQFSPGTGPEPLPEDLAARPAASAIEAAVFAARTPEYIADVQNDPRWPSLEPARVQRLHAWAGVPMVAQGAAVGVLSLHFLEPREFSPDDKELMMLLADHAAIAIENRRNAERLRAAHSQTEQLLASISWILIAIDADGTVTRWNQAAERSFDIPAAQVMGRRLADSGIDWNWDWMLRRIAEACARDHPTRFDEIRYRRADGKERFLGITLTPITAGSGQPAGLLLLGSDITERKVLETQLSQSQRLEAIGRLAAGVAHEVNTPIQFVGDNTRFLQTAFDDLHRLVSSYQALRDAVKTEAETSAVLAELERVEQAVDVGYLVGEIPVAVTQTLDGVGRVATIVQALKEFAHPDEKEKVATDINQALLSTLSVARNEIKYVADVETDFAELPLVVCQPGELNQVFLNVIVNAAHAIADAVADSGQRGMIRVRTAREDDRVLVAISDTGTGVPEAHRARLFDPFFTTKEVGRGTGQGLALAHSVVVDKHGGSLTFETELGRGTTFFIRLPLVAPEADDVP
jgi:PAS domain S-box-containing protein